MYITLIKGGLIIMFFIDILQNALYINSFLFFSLTIVVVFSITKDGFFIAKLSKKIRVLESSHMTSEMVEDLINFIDVKHIPFIWYSERLLKGGYKLVLLEESLDEQIKDILKRKLLSRGIIVD